MCEKQPWYVITKQHSQLIQILRTDPTLDKTKIAEKIGVSYPTLYKAYDELKNSKILSDDNKINKEYGTFVGVSIGTALCKITFLHFDFTQYTEVDFKQFKNLIFELSKNNTEVDFINLEDNSNYIYFHTPSEFRVLKNTLDIVFEGLIKKCENDQEFNLLSIGISCTGSVDESDQTVRESHNLNYLEGRRIEDLLFFDKNEFFKSKQIDCFLVQNSKAAVIAEKFNLYEKNQPEDLKNCKNVAAVYLEYGVGVGLVIDNKLFSGSSGYAGEVGHIPISYSIVDIPKDLEDNKKRICTCGSSDCVDNIIRSFVFNDSPKDFKCMLSSDIELYLKDNPINAKYLAQTLGYIANLVSSILNVDLIIFTGKLYKSIDVIKKVLEETLDKNNSKYNRRDCRIHMSRIGTMAPSIGAAIYSYYRKSNLQLDWS